MFKRKKSSGKSFPVKITTMDAELEFSLRWKATGQELFDLVCRTIGLRETWYFGLQYEDSKGYIAWLKMDKRVRDQDVKKTAGEPVHFLVSGLANNDSQNMFSYLLVSRVLALSFYSLTLAIDSGLFDKIAFNHTA